MAYHDVDSTHLLSNVHHERRNGRPSQSGQSENLCHPLDVRAPPDDGPFNANLCIDEDQVTGGEDLVPAEFEKRAVGVGVAGFFDIPPR